MAKIVVNGNPVKIAVSACLLGELVRYDGGHRRHDFVADKLPHVFEVIPICPEVAVGMGVPRPTIQLVKNEQGLRALGVEDPSRDVTDLLLAYGRKMVGELNDVCGFIFKSRSPSCGLKTPVLPEGVSPGLFAQEMLSHDPVMPIVEDEDLMTPEAQQAFIDRVARYARTSSPNKDKL